jgi:tetratricopeptide (TPR) repeat protein
MLPSAATLCLPLRADQFSSGHVHLERIEQGQMIASCVNRINEGSFTPAEADLTTLLKRDPKCYQALVARGTCRALAGSTVPAELRKADADFSKAIEVMPHLADVWKRRSQARAALGQMKEATLDLENALCRCSEPPSVACIP